MFFIRYALAKSLPIFIIYSDLGAVTTPHTHTFIIHLPILICLVAILFNKVHQNTTKMKTSQVSVHEGKKPFNCYICDYKFSQKGRLTSHISLGAVP